VRFPTTYTEIVLYFTVQIIVRTVIITTMSKTIYDAQTNVVMWY